jgi:AhpD family alkylhydroperoxidase
MMSESAWLTPKPAPLLLRPLVWLAERIAGGPLMPARLLAMSPKLALGAGLLEALSASAPRDLDARSLATARLVASAVVGCPFCLDMNAATWRRAGLSAADLEHIWSMEPARWLQLGPREAVAARYAYALSQTPVSLDDALRQALLERFSEREIVVLATTISQVNLWSRFGEGLGVAPLGLAQASQCPVAPPER